MENKPIGIFDSGVGGLTVLAEIKKLLPNQDIIYLGDTLNFPYGSKTKEEIIKYSKENVEFLLSQNVKLVVIACGTATSQALDVVQEKYNVPIIGIIEPTIEYIKALNIKEIRCDCNRRHYKKRSMGKKFKTNNPRNRSNK
ncbi:MAG: hypothetical protein HFJ52_04350 [Clostridia bacterium]|jgi:glutamate racemase|nr:hypothetical protein [Clostridia bacterium]